MRTHLGGLAALCVGACFVWSCQGEVGPNDSIDSTGAAGAKGATGGTSGRSTGQSGAAGNGVDGSTAQPVGGASKQPAGGTGVAPTAGTTGTGGAPPSDTTGTSVTPTAGTTGTGVTPTAGTTGTGSAPATGMGATPVTGTGGAPPTGNAGTGATPPTGTTVTTGTAGTGGAPVKPPPQSTAASTIVPLYTSPGDSSWNAIVAAKMAHPAVGVIAIVNPANGPGGSPDAAYTSGIARLVSAGIRVVGYVATGYTANSPASVKADIDRWKAFYPMLTGIFFDEQSNRAGDVPYYRDLSQYSKAQGLSFTIGNPGTDTAEGYIGALDTMLIYESAGLPSVSQMGGWHTKYAPSNFGIIPYATQLDAAFVRNARNYVQYVYLQTDSLPNPWDSLPSYFSDLLAALE